LWKCAVFVESRSVYERKALLVAFKDDALTIWPVNRQRIGNVRNKEREVAEAEALT
jgi:hypothetical protein